MVRKEMVSVIGRRWINDAVLAVVQDELVEAQGRRAKEDGLQIGSDVPWALSTQWSAQLGLDNRDINGEVLDMQIIARKLKRQAMRSHRCTDWMTFTAQVNGNHYVACEMRQPHGAQGGVISIYDGLGGKHRTLGRRLQIGSSAAAAQGSSAA